ncbi:MAG: diguanylate cyclase [Nitrospinae bacterium]|nr:diguanylate cyclase [Nitrospinota bacterium]
MNKRVLVIDDSKTQLVSLQMSLQKDGFDVITAGNGMEGVSRAFRDNPDIVVSDVMMPELNGYQLCRLLKNNKETSDIPIILLTSMDQPQDRFWGIRAGADRFIVKSSDFSVLKDTIRLLLKDSKTSIPKKKDLLDNRGAANWESIKSSLNQLLDRLLFESTLSNEVGRLANFIHDRNKLLSEASLLVNSLIDYSSLCLCLFDINGTKLYIELKQPMSDENISEIKSHILLDIHDKQKPVPEGFNQGTDEAEIHFLNNSSPIDNSVPDKITARLSAPLNIHNENIGNISLYTTKSQAFDKESENIIRLLATDFSMVLKLMLLYDETRHLSITDGLTKLYNSRYFKEMFEMEFERAKRFKKNLSMIILDIDHFKSINDTYGHLQGDTVLKEVGYILKQSVRKVDFVARYGGEEFAVLAIDTDIDNTCILAEKIRKQIEFHRFKAEKNPLKVTVSLGVASISGDVSNYLDLIKRADDSLYKAKEGGRNRVCVFR